MFACPRHDLLIGRRWTANLGIVGAVPCQPDLTSRSNVSCPRFQNAVAPVRGSCAFQPPIELRDRLLHDQAHLQQVKYQILHFGVVDLVLKIGHELADRTNAFGPRGRTDCSLRVARVSQGGVSATRPLVTSPCGSL